VPWTAAAALHALFRTLTDNRAAIVAQLGGTATAFRARSTQLRWWSAGARGGVAYAEVAGAWIAAGEPIAARDDLIALAADFIAEGKRRGRRVTFFATEGGLAHAPGLGRLRIGEQPYWDPARWMEKVAAHRSLREQLRRARAKGVRVRESVDLAERVDAAAGRGPLADLLARWIATRPMATLGFLVHPEPFDAAPDRRVLVAERLGTPVALVSLVPMGPGEWLVEHLVRPPDAPNGTAELLVHEAMTRVASEGARRVSLGLAPLSGRVAWWLRVARTVSTPLFNFNGLAQFKRKLRPDAWTPIYLVHPAEQNAARSLLDALRAFADGSLLRFVRETMRRSPEWALHALEWMLLPWMVLLAAAPTARWFPSGGGHAAWLAYDLVLWTVLRARRSGRRPRLTRTAALLSLADAVVGALQAARWNLPRAHGVIELTVIALAVAAPALASAMLWRADARERMLRRNALPGGTT
jgi:phosphatidylglycerol lysyltransferase